jgi:uncharacterized DUF497 family protein
MSAEFEWDNHKAAANRRSHGVAFEEAIRALGDGFAVERLDTPKIMTKIVST